MINLDDIDWEEKPDEPTETVRCVLCKQPMRLQWFWWELGKSWKHPNVHEKCIQAREKELATGRAPELERPIPDRFQDFDIVQCSVDKAALAALEGFEPTSRYHVIALIGTRGKGKSRLMWQAIKTFFDKLETETGAKRWVNYFTFADLMTSYDRNTMAEVKGSKYCFIDDIDSAPSGRERGQLQNVIRARVQNNQWTFMTIDNVEFDPGFRDLFTQRAVVIYV